MGIRDSDYKPHGSISNNQIAPQRKDRDTYFGELVLKNTKDGENTADNVRSEIFDLSTARLRRYKKKGKKYGFEASITFPQYKDTSGYAARISSIVGRPVDSISTSSVNDMTLRKREMADLSTGSGFYTDNYTTPGGNPAIGGMILNGVEKYITSDSTDFAGFPCQVEVFHFEDGTTYKSSIPIPGGSSNCEGDYSINDPKGYYAEYKSGSKTYYFWSQDPYFTDTTSVSGAIEVFPIIPFQDNNNGELAYESNIPPDVNYGFSKSDQANQPNWEFIRRREVIRALDMDFETMSRQIYGFIPQHLSPGWNETYGYKYANSPKLQRKYSTSLDYHDSLAEEVDIPPFGSPEWTPYKRSWKSNMKNCCRSRNADGSCTGAFDNNPRPEQKTFCEDNPTEQAYYDGLVEEKSKVEEGSRNITDVYFGLFVTAKKLDSENCVALFYTLRDILPYAQKVEKPFIFGGQFGYGSPEDPDTGEPVDNTTYMIEINSSSLHIKHLFDDWSICRRYGVADPIVYPPGSKNAKYKHGDFTILAEGEKRGWNEADLPEYSEKDLSYEYTRAPVSTDYMTMLEVRVQDKNDDNGRPRYLEMRLYQPQAEHIVDVIRDGEFGQSGKVELAGGLYNYFLDDPEKPYSDVLVWPISVLAADEVKLFRRERLLRECTIFYVAAIKMEEVKWYQQGWFRIVMVIISLVIIYLSAGTAAQGVIAVLKAVATMVVLQIITMLVDNPILQAILKIAVMIYSGYISGTNILSNPMFYVEATGTLVQSYIAHEMIKLQEEVLEWRKTVNEKEADMEKMKREVGNDEFNKEWMLYVASLAPTEYPDDFFDRALNKKVNETTQGGGIDSGVGYPAPQS